MFHTRPSTVTGYLLCLCLALGCAATRTVPIADHLHGPLPHQYLRAPDYNVMTFWAMLDREVYEPAETLADPLSLDQGLIIHEFGPPDYLRTFESREREEVVEWLCVDQNLLCQFISGALVYQGEIRDLEHTLLRLGRPNDVMTRLNEGAVERVTLIYSRAYTPNRDYFEFSDGHLVMEEHHR